MCGYKKKCDVLHFILKLRLFFWLLNFIFIYCYRIYVSAYKSLFLRFRSPRSFTLICPPLTVTSTKTSTIDTRIWNIVFDDFLSQCCLLDRETTVRLENQFRISKGSKSSSSGRSLLSSVNLTLRFCPTFVIESLTLLGRLSESFRNK